MVAGARITDFFRGIDAPILRRPRTVREALQRLIILAFMALAGLTAFLVGGGSADISEVSDAPFLAQLEQLDGARAEFDLLSDDPNASAADIQAIEARIEDLEAATFIGYIERDGDAPREGAIAPDFRLLNLGGQPVQLSTLGKPAIVNFWASWCAFCIEEMPDFQRVHLAVGGHVEIIGINREEALATAQRFAGETGATYTLLLDLDDELGGRGGPYQVVGMPTTLYVRADGRVDTVKVGFHTFEEMTELTNRLLDDQIEFETEDIDTAFVARAADLLDSQAANHAVAGELFARLQADPAVIDDIAWQRNVTAQARIWIANLKAWATLPPPSSADVLTRDVQDALEVLEVAAGVLEAGVTATDADQIGRGITIFEDGVDQFVQAAENLRGFLATQ
jgi:thiol-disulfide isomerase/thioredoxin